MDETNLRGYSNEELIQMVNSLKKRKKFGLVWEDKPEKVATDCEIKLPVVKEVAEKAINEAGDNEPTNIIIEGDNYHALSVLNYTHPRGIDVIYIDPPYNTGNKDFRYNDNFVDKEDNFRHSKWLSFMSKRLVMAKTLLAEDGVIFISIDDNEYANLKILCDEIFGKDNYIDTIIWKKTENIKMDSKFLSQNKDYILVYRRSLKIQEFAKEMSTTERFKLEDEKGRYYLRKLDSKSHTYTKGLDYVIEHDGVCYYAGGSKMQWEQRQRGNVSTYAPRWLWSKKNYEQGLKDGEIVFKNGNVYNKVRYDGKAKKPFIDIQTLVSQQTGQKELDSIFGKRVFDHPKPTEVIQWLVKLLPDNNNATILDFFAGSGTTGHAVMKLNQEDGGHRQFIICTNNENNIAEEVTYPRIKGVIDGYGNVKGIPANVRYFKTEFVEKDETPDVLRRKLSPACEDMIRIREGAFEEVIDEELFKVYKNSRGFTAVVFDRFSLQEYIDRLEEIETEAPIHLYVFSYSRNNRLDELNGKLKHKYESQPIPEGVLEIYKRIFKNKGGRQ